MAVDWTIQALGAAKKFAKDYGHEYRLTNKQLSASFEVGSFHSLVDFYAQVAAVTPKNLDNGVYKYLTGPGGNPENFSYVEVEHNGETFEIRQQVRVRSHVHHDVCFTPDLVVLPAKAPLFSDVDAEYAAGKRRLWGVSSEYVVAAHECKSLVPFPELLIGFIGMVLTAHPWIGRFAAASEVPEGPHLAPTLFVGGSTQGLQRKMVAALEQTYPVNIVTGLHFGTWDLFEADPPKRRVALLSSKST
ncbi:MAG: hypothetical protein JOZ54_02830 [Acidobacteria bacterium]|nr:hypothetical protein [Acidobacteriota bacterium]